MKCCEQCQGKESEPARIDNSQVQMRSVYRILRPNIAYFTAEGKNQILFTNVWVLGHVIRSAWFILSATDELVLQVFGNEVLVFNEVINRHNCSKNDCKPHDYSSHFTKAFASEEHEASQKRRI